MKLIDKSRIQTIVERIAKRLSVLFVFVVLVVLVPISYLLYPFYLIYEKMVDYVIREVEKQ